MEHRQIGGRSSGLCRREDFLPVSKGDMAARGWTDYDFLVITGDAYVDHPTFGPAIISRVLEAEGYRVAVMAQPDWRKPSAFTALGRPRLGVFLSGGNIDSMVAHYTVAKRRRAKDAYSPGNRTGLRPDRATIVYSNRIREVFGDIPLIIGGLEASLRRYAHYDYWEDKVRRSILFDSQADLLVYGMGEKATREIAARLASGTPVGEITDVKGTCFAARNPGACVYPMVECPSFEEVCADKRAYAQANRIQYEEHDAVRGRAILQRHGDQLLIANPPAMPLNTKELDEVAELPYVREPHPMYDEMGGVPAIEEVRFSVAQCASRWPITGAALGHVTSVPWPFTRAGWSPAAARTAWCGRWRPSPSTPASRGISTTWGAPPPISGTCLAKSRPRRGCAATGPAWPPRPAPIWMPTTPTTSPCCAACGRCRG